MVLNKVPDLRRNFCTIPSHNHHLTNGPSSKSICVSGVLTPSPM